jgi:cellulose synthase/poly-beta-1,6-N-acetylglucosamine synthase-like glycosyltransferase
VALSAAIEILFWMSGGLILYGYVFYPILLLILNRIHGDRPKTPAHEAKGGAGVDHRPETLPSVSVLIAAYNEEGVIEKRIGNLLELDYPKNKIEIVIASDGSTDGTDDIIKKYSGRGVKLFRVEGRVGKVNVINKAVPDLTGEIIVLSDANTFYMKDAVSKLVRNFEDKSIGCVCGELNFYGENEGEVVSLEGAYWRYEQFLKRNEGSRGSLLGANGGIYAIRKELFVELPPNTIVEDFVLPMKILEKGYKVIYEPEAIAYEETSKKIIQEMERRIRIGAGDFQALMLTWKLLNPMRGFTALAYFSHKVIRWFAPFLLMSVFATNLMLAGLRVSGFAGNEYYLFMLLLQVMFYLTALVGRIFSQTGVRLKFFGLPYYFVSMNIALFLGFIRFCANSQNVAWQRTER